MQFFPFYMLFVCCTMPQQLDSLSHRCHLIQQFARFSHFTFAETCCLFMQMQFHLSLHHCTFPYSFRIMSYKRVSELCRRLTVTACLLLDASRARVSVCDSWSETLASVTAYAGNVLRFSGRERAKKEQDNKSFSLRLTPERVCVGGEGDKWEGLSRER